MKLERLDKLLADAGLTRSEARAAIRNGHVTADGAVQRDPGVKLPRDAVLALRGQPLVSEEYVYYMLHKPAGYVSASMGEGDHPPVTDLLPPDLKKRGLFCVGRLDADVTGLLLLTDDGAWAHRIASPRSAIPKVYRARTDGPLTPDDAEALAHGVTLRSGVTYRPARLQIGAADPACALVTVTEGKFHEVKNLFAARGRRVLALERLSIGGVRLDPSLSPGEGRRLTSEEKETLTSKC